MAGARITRRQKNIARLLREKKDIYRDRLKTFKNKSIKRASQKCHP